MGTWAGGGAGAGTDGTIPGAQCFIFTGRSQICSPSDGRLTFFNNAKADFGLVQFGGTSSSFPALKRNGTSLDVRLADDSGYANAAAGTFDAVTEITRNGSTFLNVAGDYIVLGDDSFVTGYSYMDGLDKVLLLQEPAVSLVSLDAGNALFEIASNTTAAIIQFAVDTSNGRVEFNSDSGIEYSGTAQTLATWSNLSSYNRAKFQFRADHEGVSAGPHTIATSETGKTFTDLGSSGPVVHTLPTATMAAGSQTDGVWYRFVVTANGITVTAASGDTIQLAGAVSAVGGTAASTTVGDVLELVCVDGSQWFATTIIGTWVVT